MGNNYATLESQLGNEVCNVEDTEEIFWLKMSDDYQSKVKAGDLLVRQYRFKDAIKEYENACKIKQDDYMLYIKLGAISVLTFVICSIGINSTFLWLVYYKNMSYFAYLIKRYIVLGQLIVSIVNYALLFIFVPIIKRIAFFKDLNL